MKQITYAILSILLMTSLQSSFAESAVSAGGRYHARHTTFEELPFDKGDISYTVGYEYHDQAGYWQLLVGYTPEVADGLAVDSVITPQLNLLIKDRAWIAGTGILGSYIETELESDWTDVYWQVMLGFELPLPVFTLEILAYYPFESWSDFDEFDTDDLEYGLSMKFMF
jgi:hypothetical protein